MAKTAAKRSTRIESKVVDYAEELGRMLGTLRARVDRLGSERRKIAQQLSTVVKDAQSLLTELGHEAASRVNRLTKSPRRKRKTTKNPKGKTTRRGAKA